MEKVGDDFKLRGMTHWCYPNFGKAEGLPQHGFLRESLMEARRPSDEFAEFRKSFAAIDGFPWESRVLIENGIYCGDSEHYDHLTSSMTITNTSYRREYKTLGDMPILPALHPYFCVEPIFCAIPDSFRHGFLGKFLEPKYTVNCDVRFFFEPA